MARKSRLPTLAEWLERDTTGPARVGAPRLIGDRVAVDVELRGVHGRGQRMTVDEWRWPLIRAALGDDWGVHLAQGTHRYVIARGPLSGLRLARWITRATPSQVVSYVSRDPLDLRASNLALADAASFVAGVFGWAAPRPPPTCELPGLCEGFGRLRCVMTFCPTRPLIAPSREAFASHRAKVSPLPPVFSESSGTQTSFRRRP